MTHSSLLTDAEKFLGISNQFHQKKLRLALRSLDSGSGAGGESDSKIELDVMWICSWLDDIGLPGMTHII